MENAESAETNVSVKLRELLIDDLTWRVATRPRRAEWLLAIGELCEESQLSAPQKDPLRAYVTVESDRIVTVFHDPRGSESGRLELPRTVIAPVFREYMALLSSISGQESAGYSPQVEALDIARRLIHNDAADLIMRRAKGVIPSHKTARKLFTLLVILTHDTTKL